MAKYLIIGAAGGIGTALVERLANAEHDLHLAGRTRSKVEELAARVGGTAHEVEASSFEAVEQLVKEAASEGPLDGVVNLAGSIQLKPAHLVTPEEFRKAIDQNITSAFALVRAAAIAMQRGGSGGSIVLMSSTAGRIGLPNHELIAAAKAGVMGLVQAAAATYAAAGVRVNCVAPGLVQTPLAEGITKSEASREASRVMHPLGRLGEPTDIAPMIEFLLGSDASWITGQCFGVDGGLATVKSLPKR